MEKLIGTIGIMAVVAVMAMSAAAAKAQTAIEYGLMSGSVASANGGPEVDAIGSAARRGSDHGLESGRKAPEPSAFSTAKAGTPRSGRCSAIR